MISRMVLRITVSPLWVLFLFSLPSSLGAEPIKNVVLITLDGLRSEEVFQGADERLLSKEHGVEKVDTLRKQFWRESAEERREVLLPFLWERFRSDAGWIAGDVDRDSIVHVKNGLNFSYPGYNELLTGQPDPAVDSNDKKYNKNVTFLEWLHSKPQFRGKVAAFTSWDVFPFIINDRRSGIPVNSGWQKMEVGNREVLEPLNLISEQLFHQFEGVRYDSITMAGTLEYIRAQKPQVLYLSLGETDDWAHAGRYDRYLQAARQNDALIRHLWETMQGLPEYRDTTAFLLTSDHGRGVVRDGWKNHGKGIPGSDHVWVGAFGPGLLVHGNDQGNAFSLGQIAATAAALLGEDFQKSGENVGAPLPIAKP